MEIRLDYGAAVTISIKIIYNANIKMRNVNVSMYNINIWHIVVYTIYLYYT